MRLKKIWTPLCSRRVSAFDAPTYILVFVFVITQVPETFNDWTKMVGRMGDLEKHFNRAKMTPTT